MARGQKNQSALYWLDQTVGGVLSWLAGKDTIRRGGSSTNSAAAELLSWTGLVKRGGR